jgi:hypothetical protein
MTMTALSRHLSFHNDICRKTRMKKEAEDRFSHSLTVTSQPLPSPVENDYDNEYNGHYYDPVGNGFCWEE